MWNRFFHPWMLKFEAFTLIWLAAAHEIHYRFQEWKRTKFCNMRPKNLRDDLRKAEKASGMVVKVKRPQCNIHWDWEASDAKASKVIQLKQRIALLFLSLWNHTTMKSLCEHLEEGQIAVTMILKRSRYLKGWVISKIENYPSYNCFEETELLSLKGLKAIIFVSVD